MFLLSSLLFVSNETQNGTFPNILRGSLSEYPIRVCLLAFGIICFQAWQAISLGNQKLVAQEIVQSISARCASTWIKFPRTYIKSQVQEGDL